MRSAISHGPSEQRSETRLSAIASIKVGPAGSSSGLLASRLVGIDFGTDEQRRLPSRTSSAMSQHHAIWEDEPGDTRWHVDMARLRTNTSVALRR